MRLTANLAFLATLLVVFLAEVSAAPMKRNTRPITIPIRSIHGHDRGDLHPQLYLQQHINRAERRLARMTGRQPPTDADLRARLDKRMYIIGKGPVGPVIASRKPGSTIPRKRYFQPTAMIDAFRSKLANKIEKTKGGSSGAVFALNDTIASNQTGSGINVGVAVANGTGAAANASVATDTGANATAPTGQGVAQVNIDAVANNTLTEANPPTTSNSLGLAIEGGDTGYLAKIGIGTSKNGTDQPIFEVLMDSGSADFWVGSETCQSQNGGGCGPHKFLGPELSSTFVDDKVPFNVTYGTGQVQGTTVHDTVTIAGLVLKAHPFGTTQVESVQFTSDLVRFDGLMGLAQSGLSQQKLPTPVESLATAGLIPAAITSYKISRLADQKNDGEITFGALDTTKFDSTTLVTVNNVNTQGFWEAPMDAVTVDGQDSGLQGRTAIFDTGTTLIVTPTADADAIHNLIKGAKSDGQGGFTVPCTTTASVALKINGRSFAIDPRDIAALPLDPNNPTGDCTSGISGGNASPNQWLVGDVFLKNAYFSTDVGANTLSFAKLV